MAFMTDSDQKADDSSSTYTLRSISPVTDLHVTAEAKTAGKPKGSYVREFIEEHLGDPVTSWTRSNMLVASMDEDLAESCGATLSRDCYEICLSVQEAQAYRRLLNINSNAELKRVLFDNAAYLHYRASQELARREVVPRGISMKLALFCELAGRDKHTVDEAWLCMFFTSRPDAYEKYLDDIEAIRERKKLPPLAWSVVHRGKGATVKIRRPEAYDDGAWRVEVSLAEGGPDLYKSIPVETLPSRLLIADPGYTGIVQRRDGAWVAAMRFINRRCALHVYTNGVSEESNLSMITDVASHLCGYVESHML